MDRTKRPAAGTPPLHEVDGALRTRLEVGRYRDKDIAIHLLTEGSLDPEGGEQFWRDCAGDRHTVLRLILLDGTGAGSGVAVDRSVVEA